MNHEACVGNLLVVIRVLLVSLLLAGVSTSILQRSSLGYFQQGPERRKPRLPRQAEDGQTESVMSNKSRAGAISVAQ